MHAVGKIEKLKDIKGERGTVVKAARVENRENGHSKFYEVALEEMPDTTYVIRTFWGAIGCKKPGTQVKHAADSVVDALAVFHDWLIEKTQGKICSQHGVIEQYKDHGAEPRFAKK